MAFDNAISLDVALRGAVRAYGDKPCLFDAERTLSFTGFGDLVTRAAVDLAASCAMGPGDRIGILDTNSIEFMIALSAAARVGAVIVPLNYRDGLAEHRFKLEHAGCSLLLHGDGYTEISTRLSTESGLPIRPLKGLGAGPMDNIRLPPPPSADQTFAICYTSGTTGTPKGAVINQQVFLMRAYKLMLELRLDATDICHFTTPMFHISCLILGAMAILRGSSQLVLPQFVLKPTLERMQRHRVTFANMVPTILDMIVNEPDYAPADFGHLRRIMYTAAPMPLPLLIRVMKDYGGDLVQFLGQTEDLPQTVLTAQDHRRALSGEAQLLKSVGRPSMGVELKICDGTAREVGRGEIGEVVTRGGTAMDGYWHDGDATTDALRDGWVHSGDLAYQDPSGYVYLAGRKKHMIIRGGENIYPAEIEQVLATVDGIREAVVIGLPDSRWGEIVAAVIVADDQGQHPTAAAIIAYARTRLAGYKCPSRIVFRDALPYNAAGKVERHRLQEMIAVEPSSERWDSSPQS